jgi:hypothetical protein
LIVIILFSSGVNPSKISSTSSVAIRAQTISFFGSWVEQKLPEANSMNLCACQQFCSLWGKLHLLLVLDTLYIVCSQYECVCVCVRLVLFDVCLGAIVAHKLEPLDCSTPLKTLCRWTFWKKVSNLETHSNFEPVTSRFFSE